MKTSEKLNKLLITLKSLSPDIGKPLTYNNKVLLSKCGLNDETEMETLLKYLCDKKYVTEQKLPFGAMRNPGDDNRTVFINVEGHLKAEELMEEQ